VNSKIGTSLIAVILLASIFRLYHLGSNPPALFRDEAEKGYTAYSIAHTGGYFYFTDSRTAPQIQFQPFPLFINVLGVTTSAIYQYATVPFVWMGGLSEFTIRLPAAIAGILTVLVTFFLLLKVSDRTTALIGAFLLAVSPWHVPFSRWALQGIFVPLFVSAGLWLFLIASDEARRKKVLWYFLSTVCFSLAFYAYAVARIFVPLFLFLLVFSYFSRIKKDLKFMVPAVLLLVILSGLVTLFYLQGGRAARFQYLSVFGGDRSFFQSLWLFIKNYVRHFSPSFLFIKGDDELRHSLVGMGQMYLFAAPLLLYGLWLVVKNLHRPFNRLLFGWLLIFPVAASLTDEGIPHALRSIVALPVPQIICALGASRLIQSIQARRDMSTPGIPTRSTSRILTVLIIVVIVLSIALFAFNLFVFYPRYSAINWQYGVKQSLEYLNTKSAEPEKVYFSGYIAYAPYLVMCYEKIPPAEIKQEGMKAIGYNFLPPRILINRLWEQLPHDSYLILYPGELMDVQPEYIISLPRPRNTKAIIPALMIYYKQ